MLKRVISMLFLVVLVAPTAMAASKVYQISDGLDNNSQILIDTVGIFFVSENRAKKEFSIKSFKLNEGVLDTVIIKKDPIRIVRSVWYGDLYYILNSNKICSYNNCYSIDSSKIIGDAFWTNFYIFWIQYDNDAIYLNALNSAELSNEAADQNIPKSVISYRLSDNDGSRYVITGRGMWYTGDASFGEEIADIAIFRIKAKTYMQGYGKDIFSYTLGRVRSNGVSSPNLEWRLSNKKITTPEIVNPVSMRANIYVSGAEVIWTQGGVTSTKREYYGCTTDENHVCTPHLLGAFNVTTNKNLVINDCYYSSSCSNAGDLVFSNGVGVKVVDYKYNPKFETKVAIDSFDYWNGHLAYISNGQVYYQDTETPKSRLLSIRVNDIENQLNHSGNVGIAK